MRKFVISLAAAGAALVVAAPAAAQYYPQPQPYGQGYGAPYGNAYGYNNNYGQARSLQVRVDQIQRDLVRLVQQRALTPAEYRNRQNEARDVEQRLRREARDGRGLTRDEIYSIQFRIGRLEQKIARDMQDRGRWGNYNNGYNNGYNNNGYNNGYYDRDRDGRDDRYEDDRGTRRDDR